MNAVPHIPSPIVASPGNDAIDIRVVDPIADPAWDALLWTHPGATFFHSAAWAKTLSDAYGFVTHYLVATGCGRLLGLLPLMEARSWLKGVRGVSLPFTDECSVLSTPQVNADELLEKAWALGRELGWKHLELRGGLESYRAVPESVSFYGHVLPLCGTAEEIFSRFDGSVQRNIRKAERAGVSVEFGSDVQLVRAYYDLHCRTRTKHGAPPQPFDFFESLATNILSKGHGFIALARHEGRPIAGAVFFRFARTAIYKFSASDERFQELRGTNMVIWSAVQRMLQTGVMELDFGKTSRSNEGLRRFKRQWGAEEKIIRYARYDFRQGRFVKVSDLAAGVQARIFALLPVAVSRWVGRLLYPHLS